ncbi:hypothetical protein [Neobacillus vireti]|uniref:Uncharacterized protein n=1 Tax=Neobacillus vireti LMG 21834 TaxID=1131730 RepID=A0AB94IHS5_9BACI|nr:hypothetical protein [Neobacillus vireti]ETI66590.1 hypothetical protein BAVI_21813 [Neobacillus vireti LMG 21834]KLT16730.1 hypothetical protein AA980_17020 [Neobacillus vireti]
MKKAAATEINRGQALSFRVPSDTPDHILKQLQKLKETERRNFSSKLAEFVVQGVGSSFSREKESITIPLPKKLTKVQRDWLKHGHSEALLGSILYQLISDPVRSTSLLAALNSNSLDIEEALYLQEEIFPEGLAAATEGEISGHNKPAATIAGGYDEAAASTEEEFSGRDEAAAEMDINDSADDLDNFDWDSAKQEPQQTDEVEEPDIDDLLGGFLANMNK